MQIFEHALSAILELVPPMETEIVDLMQSLNRVLMDDVIADISMPPFNKAAMDGFACRYKDINNLLEIIGFIPAGKFESIVIKENQCVRIMTGAAIPEGADTVFMLEDSEQVDNTHVRCINLHTKRNICYEGEDFKKGELLITKGTLIKPVHIGVMASVGYYKVKVSKIPRITIIATGNEIIEPNEKPTFTQIRNSTAWLIMALLQKLNITSQYGGIVSDDLEQLTKKVEKLLQECDILILTGGASKGDLDLTVPILRKLNFNITVDRTGLQPGNPMIFASRMDKFCFGLSGNPVSSLVQFELLVRPFLYKWLGHLKQEQWNKAILDSYYERKNGNRLGIIPVNVLPENRVIIIPFHGSAHLNAWINADALMKIPEHITKLNKNDIVYVRPL